MWAAILLMSVLLACLGAKHGLRHRAAVQERFENWKQRLKVWKWWFDIWKHRWQVRFDHRRRRRQFRREWHPTLLDSSSLSRKIEQVRQDPIGVLRSRPPGGGRTDRSARVRDCLSRLPHFRKGTEETADDPNTENRPH